jgi:hypothetical protein
MHAVVVASGVDQHVVLGIERTELPVDQLGGAGESQFLAPLLHVVGLHEIELVGR